MHLEIIKEIGTAYLYLYLILQLQYGSYHAAKSLTLSYWIRIQAAKRMYGSGTLV
jgi:hypothetical protein